MFIQTQWLIIEIIFYPQIAKELIEAGGGGGGGEERDSYFTWPDKIGLDNDAHTYKTINEIKNKMT